MASPLSEDLLSHWNEPALEAIVGRRGALDRRDRNGATALWHAVYFGKPAWVERLLKAGASLDAHDVAALDRAQGSGHTVAVWQSLPANAPATPSGKGTLLHTAVARVGSAEVIRLLLDRGVPVDGRDRFGSTALHIATFRGDADAIELLVSRGADVNATDRVGYTALDHAHLKLDCIRALLKRGAKPDSIPRARWPHSSLAWGVFTYAAQGNRVDVLNALLDAGADVALHPEALPLAAKQGGEGAVRRLIAAGADLDATIEWRGRARTPLEAAAMYASVECARHLIPVCPGELDRALDTAIDFSNEDTTEAPNNRQTPRRETVKLLLEAGAKPTAALHTAAGSADAWFVATLLERGADLHALDDLKRTPLHCAAAKGRADNVKTLLAAGADPHATASDGATAWELARRAYRDDKIDDARLVMQTLDAAGAAPPEAPPPPVVRPAGISVGSTVRHAKFGDGTVVAMSESVDEKKLTIEFASVGQKTLLTRFVTEVVTG